MNKKGAAISKGLVWFFAIALIAIISLGAFAIFGNPFGAKQTTVGGTGQVVSPPGGGAGVNVYTSALSLTYSGTDKLQTGTNVGVTAWKKQSGTARFVQAGSNPENVNQGTTYDILFVNASTYHNAYLKAYTVPAGTANTVEGLMYGNASLTMRVFNTNQQVMTASGAGGASSVNQTVATGGSYNIAVWMDGQDRKGTQDMVCVLEGSDTTKIDKLTLSGGGATFVGMSKPASYTLGATTSGIWVYDVPPINGATSVQFTLGASSKSGQSMASKYFKIACYTKEYFIDPNTGDVAYDIEDTNGALKSLSGQSYTFTGYFI